MTGSADPVAEDLVVVSDDGITTAVSWGEFFFDDDDDEGSIASSSSSGNATMTTITAEEEEDGSGEDDAECPCPGGDGVCYQPGDSYAAPDDCNICFCDGGEPPAGEGKASYYFTKRFNREANEPARRDIKEAFDSSVILFCGRDRFINVFLAATNIGIEVYVPLAAFAQRLYYY